jgi:hypothetical protein
MHERTQKLCVGAQGLHRPYAITGSDVDELWHHLGDARSKGSAAQRGTTTEPSTVVASGLTEATNQQRILHHLTIWIHLHITDDAKVSCI